ncbi:MAG: Trm112 family protein [Chloroflexi bacterium]|nr:Trm112 family protein [Chloroflexota bacterium]
MLSEEFLAILACPFCKAKVELVGKWLVCKNPECARKYPIRNDIPVMLIEEGDKYRETPVSELPEL